MDIHTHYSIQTGYSSTSNNKQDIGDIKAKNSSAQLSESEASKQHIIRELSARDREVRAHEQAHKAAAGVLAQGAPSYTYQRGPNGKLYAVGGEVKIDTAPVAGDPKATLEKAEQIIRAALAPAQPSSQDRAVAAQARQMAMQARAELQTEQAQNKPNQTDDTGSQPAEYSENPNQDAKANQALSENKTGSECAICGGQHTIDTHILISALITQ